MNRFSIIVPFLEDSASFDDTLASVLRYRPSSASVIVVHDGDYNDPHELGCEIEIVEAQASSSRAAAVSNNRLAKMLAAAVDVSSSQCTVLVRQGIELGEGWDKCVSQSFANEEVAAVIPSIVARDAMDQSVCCGIEVEPSGTRRLSGVGLPTRSTSFESRQINAQRLGPSVWFGVWRTRVLEMILPFADVEDIYLDVELALLLREMGCRTVTDLKLVGYAAFKSVLLDEQRQAHGASAQRGLENYLSSKTSNSLIKNVLGDLGRTPIEPWRLSHALQRLAARKWRRRDRLRIQQFLDIKNAPQTLAESGSGGFEISASQYSRKAA